MDKIMLSLTGFAAEMEREKARQRTYEAMLRKAKALHVTGGKLYGYDNAEVLGPDGTRQRVSRQINLEQAAVVRQIFGPERRVPIQRGRLGRRRRTGPSAWRTWASSLR
jgi:DNA invertase Pin-like site-specific DNA recombinase